MEWCCYFDSLINTIHGIDSDLLDLLGLKTVMGHHYAWWLTVVP